MAFDLNALSNMGLSEVVLWLLSFALVYGVLTQAKLPQSQASRMIIAIVISFFVLFSAPVAIINFLSTMTSGLILILVGVLILAIFLEVAQIKVSGGEFVEYDAEGKPVGKKHKMVSVFEKYGYIFFAAFLIIAALIFVNSGGLQLLGWNINLSGVATTTTVFFIFMILAILWMVGEKK